MNNRIFIEKFHHKALLIEMFRVERLNSFRKSGKKGTSQGKGGGASLCTSCDRLRRAAGGKKAYTFLFSAVISISMWIYTRASAEYARYGASRGIYGRGRAGPRFINTLCLH